MSDFYNLSQSQQQKIFQLMDMMGINNIQLASTVLSVNGWNLQRALDNFLSDNSPSPPTMIRQPSLNSENSDEWEKFDPTKDIETKLEDFNTLFPQTKLSQQMSDSLMNRIKSRTKDEQERIQHYVDKFIKENPKFSYNMEKSQRQIDNNRKFIQYLNKQYKPSINFALGSFSSVTQMVMKNLMKSFVKKKPLLVYVHRATDSKAANSILTRILQDSGISNFINSNFIIYGMFDNSEDYSIVQPQLPPPMLPGFAIYIYDQKSKSQKCLGSRTLLRNQPRSLADFMKQILQKGSSFNKTPENPQQVTKLHEQAKQSQRRLKDQQQQIYDTMQQEWKLKREESKLRKVNKQQAKLHVDQLKKKFEVEPTGAETIEIHFRLPVTGTRTTRRFDQKDVVEKMFVYVEAFCSEDFENQFGEFDLVQTYPPLSLLSRREETIEKVFEGSTGEILIIKEI